MWLDNASNIDMLFYSPYADTIVNFTKNTSLTPLTIGLYGSWGAGKSSLLHLIEQRIKASGDRVVCVSLNAWQFEGYEDAKIAIMESLLNALKDNKTFAEKCHDNCNNKAYYSCNYITRSKEYCGDDHRRQNRIRNIIKKR